MLVTLTVGVVGLALLLPYLPIACVFGFVALTGPLLATVAAITLAYVLATELLKTWFYGRDQQVLSHRPSSIPNGDGGQCRLRV